MDGDGGAGWLKNEVSLMQGVQRTFRRRRAVSRPELAIDVRAIGKRIGGLVAATVADGFGRAGVVCEGIV